MKLTFRNVYNVHQFFELINNCQGPVYLQSESDDKIDLRNNSMIKDLLSNACDKGGIHRLQVLITNQKDIPQIIQYLITFDTPHR